jgi:hypothetical protein
MWIYIEDTKTKQKVYELNKVFQDVWNVKLPWVNSMVDAHGKVHPVRCKVCTKIKGKEKLLAFKLNYF